ncbi:MAG: DUF1127 domain-containing protein [Alphaproteobacteria bacterium]|nr:DUF1127 domain-containing protein [Alphaproteobacteria bacterium]
MALRRPFGNVGLGTLGAALRNGWRQLTRALAERRRVRRNYEELMRLSDRQLADIGIAREDITAVAHGGPAQPANENRAQVRPSHAA